MKLNNKVEFVVEEMKDCAAVFASDCPVGRVYDFACALQAFAMKRMQEAKDAQDAAKTADEVKPAEPQV